MLSVDARDRVREAAREWIAAALAARPARPRDYACAGDVAALAEAEMLRLDLPVESLVEWIAGCESRPRLLEVCDWIQTQARLRRRR